MTTIVCNHLLIPTLVRVFLCPCVGPVPSVGLTLTRFTWDRNLAFHVTLHSLTDDIGVSDRQFFVDLYTKVVKANPCFYVVMADAGTW